MEKKSNSFGVTFFVKKYKMVNGNVPIYVRITVNGKRADISTKRVVAEKNWNALKGQAKGSKEETVTLNNYLQQIRSAIVTDYQQMLLNKKLITAETLKLSFLGGKNEHSLNTLMEYHNTQMKSVLANGTLKNYFTTQGYIKEFLKRYYNASDIHLADLNYRFIQSLKCS